MQPWLIAVVVAATAAVGFYGGVLTEREDVTYGHFRHTVRPLARLRVIVPDTLLQPRATGAAYKVLGRTTWRQNLWGKNCSEIDQPAADAKNASRGQRALCELPSLWQNCTQGIYLDMVSSKATHRTLTTCQTLSLAEHVTTVKRTYAGFLCLLGQ